MDASQLPKGQSVEKDGSGRPRNLPGVYRHKAAGKEIITSADESDGTIQADALVRVGYTRVADVPSRVELQKMRDAQAKKDEANAKANVTEVADEPDVKHNGTTTRSAAEVEAELAETKATLEALKAGIAKQTPEPKQEK